MSNTGTSMPAQALPAALMPRPPHHMTFTDCIFVIRLIDDNRLVYDGGSTLHIDRGHLTAIDAAGTHRRIDVHDWLDVIIDAADVLTNRWRSRKR